MTCKEALVSLLDELLRIFEYSDRHKIAYRQLIILRHKIRNTHADDEVHDACRDFYIAKSERMDNKDMTVFESTPYAGIVALVWNEIGPENKELLWKWGKSIMAHCLA